MCCAANFLFAFESREKVIFRFLRFNGWHTFYFIYAIYYVALTNIKAIHLQQILINIFILLKVT